MIRTVHIIKVESIPVSSLAGMVTLADYTCRLPSNVNFTDINIQDQADAKTDDTIENKERVYTTTFSFRTCDKTPSDRRHLAFRLTTIDGSQMLVGTSSRPYAIVKEHNPYPGKPGDSVLKEVTVTWKGTLPMLHIAN